MDIKANESNRETKHCQHLHIQLEPVLKFQVYFVIDNLHITLIHKHSQVAKLSEAGLCLSKLKESKRNTNIKNRIVITIINIACTSVT